MFPLKILEKYQVYGESVLGKYGRRPNVRDVIKVGEKSRLIGLFLQHIMY